MLRLASVFSILIIFMQSGGLMPVYLAGQIAAHEKMQKVIRFHDPMHRQKMSLSISDYKKISAGNHEVVIDGKMYDIYSVSHDTDRVTVEVVFDDEETNWISGLHSMLEDQQDKPAAKEWLKKLLSGIYTFQEQVCSFITLDETQNPANNYLAILSSGILVSVFQPPTI
jgi:hypothetical protein